MARLDIEYAVVIDSELEVWRLYDNLGWPARYLFNPEGYLFEYHYGEGGYDETELAIQALLGVEQPPLPPLRPEDGPAPPLVPQSEDVAGPYSGPYEAGAVWAVLDGHGAVSANGRRIAVEHPGAYELISHDDSTAGCFELELERDGVRCHAVCFTPGLAPGAVRSIHLDARRAPRDPAPGTSPSTHVEQVDQLGRPASSTATAKPGR